MRVESRLRADKIKLLDMYPIQTVGQKLLYADIRQRRIRLRGRITKCSFHQERRVNKILRICAQYVRPRRVRGFHQFLLGFAVQM